MDESVLKMATLAGGMEVSVERRQKSAEGMALIDEKVFVRELAVKEYPKWLVALRDEERQVEIFCDREAGWAATLTAASLNAVMKAGEALNKEPFFDWCARRNEQVRRLAPGRLERVMEAAFKEALAKAPTPAPAEDKDSRNGWPIAPSSAG